MTEPLKTDLPSFCTIPLGKPKKRSKHKLFALVDAQDFDRVFTVNWSPSKTTRFNDAGELVTGYCASASIGGKRVSLHRFILDAQPGETVKHSNGNLDCSAAPRPNGIPCRSIRRPEVKDCA